MLAPGDYRWYVGSPWSPGVAGPVDGVPGAPPAHHQPPPLLLPGHVWPKHLHREPGQLQRTWGAAEQLERVKDGAGELVCQIDFGSATEDKDGSVQGGGGGDQEESKEEDEKTHGEAWRSDTWLRPWRGAASDDVASMPGKPGPALVTL